MSGIEDDLGDVWPKKLYPHGGGREWSTSTHGDTWKESAGFEVVPADALRRGVEAECEEIIERCAKALMASYWGWSAENMEAEWPELGDADQERARDAARACLRASGAVEALREIARLLDRSTQTGKAPTQDEWVALTLANTTLDRLGGQ